MKKSNKRIGSKAMSFYHADGLPAAWKHAARFAGKKGHLATMPEIVSARIEADVNDDVWDAYYTSLTAEYYGKSKGGSSILIIAHGIGPMSTLDGIQKAYSYQYKDKSRKRRGGRITREEFLDLEAGKFGEVDIIDLKEYMSRYLYPFTEVLGFSEASDDPVLRARFGPNTGTYLAKHLQYAREWHLGQTGVNLTDLSDTQKQLVLLDPDKHVQFSDNRTNMHLGYAKEGSNPYLIKVNDAGNCSYGMLEKFEEIGEGLIVAHLVSTGGLIHLCHEGSESLILDVGCHEWNDGVRLVGLKEGWSDEGIRSGPNTQELLRKKWRSLMVPAGIMGEIGLRCLVDVEKDVLFTQYLKIGESMDNAEPEFRVTSTDEIGGPVSFQTHIGGYHGFFKYGIEEVNAIKPLGANAYSFVSGPEIVSNGGDPTHHRAVVQFYKAEIDTSQRLIREKELRHDYRKMMELIEA